MPDNHPTLRIYGNDSECERLWQHGNGRAERLMQALREQGYTMADSQPVSWRGQMPPAKDDVIHVFAAQDYYADIKNFSQLVHHLKSNDQTVINIPDILVDDVSHSVSSPSKYQPSAAPRIAEMAQSIAAYRRTEDPYRTWFCARELQLATHPETRKPVPLYKSISRDDYIVLDGSKQTLADKLLCKALRSGDQDLLANPEVKNLMQQPCLVLEHLPDGQRFFQSVGR